MKRPTAIHRASAVLVTMGVLGAAALPAHAQRRPRPQQAPPAEDPRVVEARRAYDDGRRLFDERSYAEALRRFERAFELRNNPVILIAIANCHEQTNNFRDAVAALERYLRDRANAPDRAQVEQRLAQLRPRAAQQAPATNAGATGAASTTSAVSTTSATGTTSATASGTGTTASGTAATTASSAPVAATSDGAAGTTSDAAGSNGAAPGTTDGAASANSGAAGATDGSAGATEPAPPPPARGVSPAVWVCAALAGAGVAGGSVLGFLALGDHATYNTAPTRELKDRGETYALFADLSFATAVLSGFVGTVVFLSDRAEAEREQRATQSMRPDERSRRASRVRARPLPNGVTVAF